MAKEIKHWETTYTDRWSGRQATHVNSNSESDARGWTSNLSKENNCKAECHVVYKDGTRSHVTSEGDSKE